MADLTTNMQPPESALVVPVPAAEMLVKPFRDPVAAFGMPAHVTLLYPFLAPDVIDGATRVRLRKAFSCVAQLEDERRLDSIADEFARTAASALPIAATATEVALMDYRGSRWQVRTTFALGPG